MMGMTGCDAPGYAVKGAHVNKRTFGAHNGRWSYGVNLAPDTYYEGCTPLVKEVGNAPDEEGNTVSRVQYRKMNADDRCFDVVLRCDSDQAADNACRTLRGTVLVEGEIFQDALNNLPEGVDIRDIDSNHPGVLTLRAKICSGLGRPTDAQIEAWEG